MSLKIKTIILSAILILTATFACITVFGINTTVKQSQTLREEDYFILKEYNGFLAIFSSSDNETPIKTTDVFIENLPERDKTRIENGIKKSSLFEIVKILEDYE